MGTAESVPALRVRNNLDVTKRHGFLYAGSDGESAFFFRSSADFEQQ